MRIIDTTAPLVLGSGSPRRREILAQLGVPFVVHVGDADEAVRDGEEPAAYLERVVRAKLEAVRASLPERLAREAAAVLVADTTVVCDAILGKPESGAEALAMIERLSGRTHEVHTRFAIAACGGGAGALHEQTVVTRVTFRVIDAAEARGYAASGEGMDKAGGYAVQGLAMAFAERIDGSYTNVVGLPACQLVVAMKRLGLR